MTSHWENSVTHSGDDVYKGIYHEEQHEAIALSFLPNYEIIYANETALHFLQKDKDNLIGTHMSAIMSDREFEIMKTYVSALDLHNPIVTYELKKITPSDTIQYMEWTYLAIFDENSEIKEYKAISRAITDYKLSFSELKKSEYRYRTVIEAQSELVCRHKPDLTITFANNAYCAFVGQPIENIVGHSMLEEEYVGDRKKIFAYISSATPEHPNNTQTNRIITGSGETLWVEWRRKAFFNEAGEILEIQAVGRDITELKKTEKALMQSEQSLKQKNLELERKNIALQEILENFEKKKQQIKDNVIANIDNSLLPLLERFRQSCTEDKYLTYISLIEKNLEQLNTTFGKQISMDTVNLTTKEREICTLIKNGMTTKEISALLCISTNTVGRHRNNIRRKFKITNEDTNLQSFLNFR